MQPSFCLSTNLEELLDDVEPLDEAVAALEDEVLLGWDSALVLKAMTILQKFMIKIELIELSPIPGSPRSWASCSRS